jgi:hypothetical protein
VENWEAAQRGDFIKRLVGDLSGTFRDRSLRMVLRGRFFQVAIGLAISIPAAIAAGKLMTQQLFSVRPWDPVMLASATLALGLLASALPAWRAAVVEPMVALRNERGMDDLFRIKTVQISFSSSWSIC